MRLATVQFLAIIGAASLTGIAQHAPYAGQENRSIKALSAEEVKQYLAGSGMGFAKAAELNRYPGPMHVLELADELALSSDQRVATRRLMDGHKAEARAIGAKLVDAERALDQLFADGKADTAGLAAQVAAVSGLHGQYRLSHLETHRQMRALLTADQVLRYDELRGYGREGDPPPHQHPGH